jgi:hypothetical protein
VGVAGLDHGFGLVEAPTSVDDDAVERHARDGMAKVGCGPVGPAGSDFA